MLKYSVAIAALMVGAPMAFAQGAGDVGKNGGAGMSNSGPSSSGPGSAGLKSGGASSERSGGASSGASEGTSGSSAGDVAPGHQKEGGSAKENAPGQMKSEGSARDYAPGQRKDSSDKMDKRSENKSKDLDRDSKSRDRADRGGQERSRQGSDRNEARAHDHGGASTGASEGTEGRSGGRGSITSVTTEQKTKIRSVFTRHHVEPVRNLNVAVNVGVRIPHSVHLYPVPEDVIEIVPEYRDYDYIVLDDNRIAIIDPDSYEVLDIIVLT
jgi:hypothetical protein